MVQEGKWDRHPRRDAFDRSDDLLAKRSIGEGRYCDDGCFARSALTVSRSSRDRVRGQLASEPEAATPYEQVYFEEGVAQVAAEPEPEPAQNGVWSSDWSLVSRQDAA